MASLTQGIEAQLQEQKSAVEALLEGYKKDITEVIEQSKDGIAASVEDKVSGELSRIEDYHTKWVEHQVASNFCSEFTGSTTIGEDLQTLETVYDKSVFIPPRLVEKICNFFSSKWVVNPQKDYVAKFAKQKHQSLIMVKIIDKLQNLHAQSLNDLYANNSVKEEMIK